METLVELYLEPKGHATNADIDSAVHSLMDLLPETTILVYSTSKEMAYVPEPGVEIYSDCFEIDRRKTLYSEKKTDFTVEGQLEDSGIRYELCRAVPRVHLNDIIGGMYDRTG